MNHEYFCLVGVSVMAWNTIVIGKVNNSHKPMHKITLSQQQLNSAMEIQALAVDHIIDSVKQLTRITLVIDDIVDAQRLIVSNDHLRQFDIICVKPGNAQVFEHLCKNAVIDMIQIEFSTRVHFPITKTLLDAALSRSIYFEITYSPMLTSKSNEIRY